jgi:Spy/CpxP family protein refolding chaperone
MSQAALAQPGEGRGGRGFRGGMFPPSALRLATAEEVAADLKLSDEQKDKIAEINKDFEATLREAFQGGGGREKMQELMEDSAAKLAEVLDDAQEKRMVGIVIQLSGANATMDPAVAKELKITDEQKRKLGDVRRSLRDRFGEIRDLPEEERREAFQDLQKEVEKELMAVLTDEQKAQMESLKGEKIEIDMSQFRFGRGGEGRGERRGREGGERREREKEKETESSSN